MASLKPIISEHPFLRSMSSEHVEMLAECAVRKDFRAGEVIFREGDLADAFYLIETGKVVLESAAEGQGGLPVQHLGSGDVLGWSWLFPPYRYHFHARAIEPTRAVSFSGAHLLIACERDHDFGYELMKRLAQVLIGRLQATRGQRLKSDRETVPSAPEAGTR